MRGWPASMPRLIAMSMTNVLSFLKIAKGADPAKQTFIYPPEPEFFDECWRSPGLLGASFNTPLALADIGSSAQDGSASRLDALVERSTAEFVDWLQGRDGRSAAEALIERADRERETELAVLWRRVPDLEPETREAIEGMTRHLTDRLLREPLERLGRDTDGRDGQAIRDIFAL